MTGHLTAHITGNDTRLKREATVSDLRRILEPCLAKGQPSRYLLRDEETLALNPAAETWDGNLACRCPLIFSRWFAAVGVGFMILVGGSLSIAAIVGNTPAYPTCISYL